MSLQLRNQYVQSTSGPNSDAFPNPFHDVASSAVPTSLRNALYWCVLPGALVELGNALTKFIEDVLPGDFVLTRGGTVETVLNVSQHPYQGKAVRVLFSGLDAPATLQVTYEHQLWRSHDPDTPHTKHEKVEASQLVVGDYVATPLLTLDNLDVEARHNFLAFVFSDTGSGSYRSVDVRLETTNTALEWQRLCASAGYLPELFGNVLRFSEKDCERYRKGLGLLESSRVREIPCERSTLSVTPTSEIVPEGLRLLPVESARTEVLVSEGEVLACSASVAVETEGRGVVVRDGYVYRRVEKIEVFEYDGLVYNLEVENDHSFVVNGTCVANCEYIFSFMGTYRMAMERVISYFLTDIELGDASDEEKDKFARYFDETLSIYLVEQNLLRDRMCYGNAFASFIVPFRRWLGCPKCGNSWTLDTVYEAKEFKFTWADMKFIATCPGCKVGSGYRGEFKMIDRPGDIENKLTVKHWSPHEIELLHDMFTDDVAYLWRIPEDYKAQVRKGSLFHLERVSQPVLNAIRHNEFFRFDPDAIFHMKEPTLAGIRNRGWGLPRLLSNFRQVWYVQVLRRMNEAIALDYVIPFRIITPEARAGSAGGMSGDPLAMFNGGDARGQLTRMLKQRRRDPASWHVLPFPVKYNVMGGEANALAPRDLLDQGNEVLLNDIGIPVELYRGSLQVQSATPALRLFEATWQHLTHDRNRFLRWAMKQSSQILGWESVEAKHKRVTIADDVQKQMAFLQLMAAQQLSGTTGMKALGVDWKEEQRLKAEEARTQAEMQARMQEEMQQAGFASQLAKGQVGGVGAAPGAPPGSGGAPGQGQAPSQDPSQTGQPPAPVDQYLQGMSPDTPRSPNEMLQTADSLAQSLLGQPEGSKDSQLRQLKQSDPTMHSLVRSRIEQIRAQTKSQAGGMQGQGQPSG